MDVMLNLTDFASMSPLLILLGGALLLLLIESFNLQAAKKFSSTIATIVILLAMGGAYYAPPSHNTLLTPWLKFDALSQFFTFFFLFIGLAAALLAASFFQHFDATRGEYYFLLLSALFGLILIGAAADFLTLFLGIETLALSLYALCCYMKSWEISREASLKYFLMGSMAAAFLLYGIALIYGATGTTQFKDLLKTYAALSTPQTKALFIGGIALVTLGLAFEAAIVPFHLWAPDVYYGASNPVTAFMAVGTKVGAFAAFVRVFFEALPNFNILWNEGIALLIYPTLIYANIVALRQIQLRRFFAYSGISQAGFLLMPFVSGTPDALSALLFYLVVYSLATFGCFAILTFFDQNEEGVLMHHLNGLFQRSPLLAGIFSLCLLTLAGIPPTAGFFAKFFVFKVAFQAGYYGLVIVGLLTTILSAYYYLRIIALMLAKNPGEEKPIMTWPAALVGAFSFIGVLLLSFYPNFLFELIKLG